ncbi:29121_t:CDS:2, partial [Racocetra persica]
DESENELKLSKFVFRVFNVNRKSDHNDKSKSDLKYKGWSIAVSNKLIRLKFKLYELTVRLLAISCINEQDMKCVSKDDMSLDEFIEGAGFTVIFSISNDFLIEQKFDKYGNQIILNK